MSIDAGNLERAAEFGRQPLGALDGPIRDDDALATGRLQSNDDTACRATGPEHDGVHPAQIEAALRERRQKAGHIGILAMQLAIAFDDCVDGTGAPRDVADALHQGEGALFVRHRDVGADVLGSAQRRDTRGHLVVGGRPEFVATSRPSASKAACWKAGERLCSTGKPISPA